MILQKLALALFSKNIKVRLLLSLLTICFSQSALGNFSTPEALTCEYFSCESIEKDTKIVSPEMRAYLKKSLNLKQDVRPFLQSFKAVKNKKILGYGLIDSHRVRTKNQALLFIFSPSGKIQSIEILAFFEPKEYQPKKSFLNSAKNLSQKLGREISMQTGATLTSYAVDRARKKASYLFNKLVKPPSTEAENEALSLHQKTSSAGL